MNQEKPLTIKELPEEARPRERLLSFGPQSLSSAELLAILIRTGTPQESALRIAEKMLKQYDGVSGLSGVTPQELSRMKGVGAAKAVSIIAALEIGKRLSTATPHDRPVIRHPGDAADLLMPRLRYETKEHFIAILLSTKNHVLATPTVSIGSLNASVAHPRELFREVINYAAAAVIVAHNHPSGDPSPSKEDIALTRKLVEIGQLIEIPVLDHVIIGDGKYVSMKEKGII
ncbi:RadC family protein [Acetonema longum]|uniref:DNA repair protein RadC n=1 Tax=Acetonema longum DSM 6540 TaxID=1009370 RepID=F7NHN7_9FIRM|nr:DNA repair protein RadC [Acetonema longum]EGO64412.1 DNA repair protein RadC [Acetonema longum DSM 6540]